MTISLNDAGKRFNRDWIFRHASYDFFSGNAYAIIGPNGSGKSTLLQCIAGAMGFSEGSSTYTNETNKEDIVEENRYQYVAIAAPYLELVEEMTATELLKFHSGFKPFITDWDSPKIIDYIGLAAAANKQLRYYSSGMKQRLKLAQAIFSDTPVILLDEPCTNFDQAGYTLYHQMMNTFCTKRLVIVCSNELQEYNFCTTQINITAFK